MQGFWALLDHWAFTLLLFFIIVSALALVASKH
jgi:hypothetical protein